MNERGFALLAPLLGDVCLLSGFATWILIVWWLWLRGWRVQRRYFIEATLPPLRRTQITWMSALIGILAVIAAHSTPSAAALVSVAMIGTLSALTDVRTHKLPNAYTGAMALGVSIGCACAVLVSDSPASVLADIAWGGAIWAVPMWLLSRLPGGVGLGRARRDARNRGHRRRRLRTVHVRDRRGSGRGLAARHRFGGDQFPDASGPLARGRLDDRLHPSRRDPAVGVRAAHAS